MNNGAKRPIPRCNNETTYSVLDKSLAVPQTPTIHVSKIKALNWLLSRSQQPQKMN